MASGINVHVFTGVVMSVHLPDTRKHIGILLLHVLHTKIFKYLKPDDLISDTKTHTYSLAVAVP